MPAMYSSASSAGTKSANTTRKKSAASAAIVNGLMSQFTISVRTRPLGRRPTAAIERGSIASIIG